MPASARCSAGCSAGSAPRATPRGWRPDCDGLSGGERRRLALVAALIDPGDVLLLDEPTNHLDIEAVTWLARFLTGPTGPATLVVVTHDRWFLDEVATTTWEVADGSVFRFEGGYAAWVLARAERERRAAVAEARRRNLVSKELAWLRRGPPARTSKPQFRIDAANALIADVPEPREPGGAAPGGHRPARPAGGGPRGRRAAGPAARAGRTASDPGARAADPRRRT